VRSSVGCHPIPKSRLKKIKVQVEGEKFRRVPGPTEEEFSPSNRDHVIGALAHRGIYIDNVQEATLRKIDSPECRFLLEYNAAKKRLNAIKAIVRSTFSDGRVRARGWNQLAARTGRIISTEPNLQQVPKNWRTAFRVDPPLLWLKPDLSMIEVVILAVVTGDSALIDLLRRGEDVYVLVASRLFNVQPFRKEKKGCVTDNLRDQTKPVVLGTNYGLTVWGLCRRFREEFDKELSLEEAQVFFDTFFEMFPGVAQYHAKAAEDALILDCVRTAGGQRRWLPPLLESDQEDNYWPSFERRKKILMNTPIQGGQADLQIKAVNKFMRKLPAGVQVVNLVHDEADLIVTPETLHPTVAVIRSAFQQGFAELYGDVLIPQIKFSMGQNWGELQELKRSE
jgi:DNA polymerase I